MRRIANAGAVFLGLDLPVEVARHPVEFADHMLEVGDLALLLVGGEALQAERRFHVLSWFDTPN